jgi:hypothetical protein
LRDSSELINLINKKVDRLFDLTSLDFEIAGKKLSVLHIPPSINKPHIIRLYQTFEKDGSIKKEEENKVFVRKNSRVFPASKYDFELMYYDRKNIVPDYELYANYHPSTAVFNLHREDKLIMTIHLTIENTGRRPVAISTITIEIEVGAESDPEKFSMTSDSRHIASNIVIRSGEIWDGRLDFTSLSTLHFINNPTRNMKQQFYSQQSRNIRNSNLKVFLANGTIIYSELTKIG